MWLKTAGCTANSVDPDQMPYSVASIMFAQACVPILRVNKVYLFGCFEK